MMQDALPSSWLFGHTAFRLMQWSCFEWDWCKSGGSFNGEPGLTGPYLCLIGGNCLTGANRLQPAP